MTVPEQFDEDTAGVTGRGDGTGPDMGRAVLAGVPDAIAAGGRPVSSGGGTRGRSCGIATRPPTIYEVADAAGVSPSTVSRAFSRPGLVSAATARHVAAVAADLGYRAGSPARELPRDKTTTVALVVSDVTNPVYFGIIRGFESAAARAGYTTVLADTQESHTVERTMLKRVLPGVDGVVLGSSRMSDRAIRTVADRVPTVVLNRIVSGTRCLVPDTASGIGGALAHLRELDHAAVTYIAGPEAAWEDGTRWRSMLDLGTGLGLKVNRIGPFPPTLAGGLAAATEVLRHTPTAVVTYNDLLAIGLMRGLTAAGTEVPAQVSVIGFDNVFAAELCVPALTTVATPLAEMGAASFVELHRLIRREPAHSCQVVSATARLVVRGSTASRRSGVTAMVPESARRPVVSGSGRAG